MREQHPFQWRHFQAQIILLCVRWYLRDALSSRDKVWMSLSRAVDSAANTLQFLLSPTRDAQAAKRFFEKALPCRAGSAPGAHPVEKLVVQSTAAANPATTKSAPGVITVEKNAASPKAMADLKATGVLAEAVELKPGQILEEPDRARPPRASSGWSSLRWASFPSRVRGEPVPGL
jgi:hypothetical protein